MTKPRKFTVKVTIFRNGDLRGQIELEDETLTVDAKTDAFLHYQLKEKLRDRNIMKSELTSKRV